MTYYTLLCALIIYYKDVVGFIFELNSAPNDIIYLVIYN